LISANDYPAWYRYAYCDGNGFSNEHKWFTIPLTEQERAELSNYYAAYEDEAEE